MTSQTREPQYQSCLQLRDEKGNARFGLMSNLVWHEDPKRLVFMLSRYKFAAKMLSGKESVLEIGCADGFGTRIVRQETSRVTAIDFDPVFIADAKENTCSLWPIEFAVHDMLDGPFEGPFDGAFCLDVLEHIAPADEQHFLCNLLASLSADGTLIIGMPSLESQDHASPQSKEGHVNCKSGTALRVLLEDHFKDVFVFSMNDEVVHTGFFPMAHYLLAVCTGKKQTAPK